jgi:hypothetical protein
MLLFTLSACLAVVTFCAIEYPLLNLRERAVARDQEASVFPTGRGSDGVDHRLVPRASPNQI